MPRGDGTGPFGGGRFTGKGRGQCRRSLFNTGSFGTGKVGLISALVPFIGAVIRDVINPNGLISLFSRKLLGFRKPVQIKNAVETDFVVIDENKTDTTSEKNLPLKKKMD